MTVVTLLLKMPPPSVGSIARDGGIGDRECAPVDTDTIASIARDGGIGDGKVAAIVEDTSASIA